MTPVDDIQKPGQDTYVGERLAASALTNKDYLVTEWIVHKGNRMEAVTKREATPDDVKRVMQRISLAPNREEYVDDGINFTCRYCMVRFFSPYGPLHENCPGCGADVSFVKSISKR